MRGRRQISGDERGYILLGIVILMVIMGIFMGAAVPIWQHVMQREREDELIWRGNQYVRAIELYQRKHPGAFPAKFEDLVEQKFLRKLYEDPMAEDGEWKIIRQLSPEARRLGTAGRPPGAGRRGRRGEAQEERLPGRQSSMRSSSSRFGGSRGLGGIVGVVSKSEEESIRVLDGKEHYNEWLFVYAPRAQAGRAPGTRPPGAPAPPGGTQRPPRSRRPGMQQPRSPGQRPIQQP